MSRVFGTRALLMLMLVLETGAEWFDCNPVESVKVDRDFLLSFWSCLSALPSFQIVSEERMGFTWFPVFFFVLWDGQKRFLFVSAFLCMHPWGVVDIPPFLFSIPLAFPLLSIIECVLSNLFDP